MSQETAIMTVDELLALKKAYDVEMSELPLQVYAVYSFLPDDGIGIMCIEATDIEDARKQFIVRSGLNLMHPAYSVYIKVLSPGELQNGGCRMSTILTDSQPRSIVNSNPYIVDLVTADLKQRASVGKEKYGTFLQAHNGRDPMVDLYQELCDATQYIRQVLYEKYGE